MSARALSTSSTRQRAWWLKTLHQWHWISAALSLVGLLLFAITGLTLNHAGLIEASPRTTSLEATLEAADLAALKAAAPHPAGSRKGKGSHVGPVPAPIAHWLQRQWSIDSDGRAAEWSDDEVYLSLPRPGGDAWVRIDLADGTAEYELTDRGWIAWFNDLHKGRNAGMVWSAFIDLFAIACLVFASTGLLILKLHAGNRPKTWPLVGFGLLLPLLIALLFIH